MNEIGTFTYRRHIKDACEECGLKSRYMAGDYLVKRKLTIHHKDGNHSNNDPENLQTLCRKCHDKAHNM